MDLESIRLTTKKTAARFHVPAEMIGWGNLAVVAAFDDAVIRHHAARLEAAILSDAPVPDLIVERD